MDALMLDFDGVIAHSEHLHDQVLKALCEPLGLTWEGEPFVGWPDADVLRHVFAQRGDPLTPERLRELLDRKSDLVLQQIREGLYQPYPGVVELVREAASQMPVAVCSAGMREQILPVLARFGIGPLVRSVVAIEDTPRTKPHPAPYLEAARRLGVRPERAVAIEDSPRGVESALAAGVRVLAVGHTTPPSQLARAHAFAPALTEVSLQRLRELMGPEHSAPAAERPARTPSVPPASHG
jgi:HAD superfamily hydrolase (TIGR01509 family)